MEFEVEQRPLADTDIWEPRGVAEGVGDDAAKEAVQAVADAAGVYRVGPRGGDEPWQVFKVTPDGIADEIDAI